MQEQEATLQGSYMTFPVETWIFHFFIIIHHKPWQQLYVILPLLGSNHHKPNSAGEKNAAALSQKVQGDSGRTGSIQAQFDL